MSKFDSKMMDILGDNTTGSHSLPNDWASMTTKEGRSAGDIAFRIGFTNDAYQITVAYADPGHDRVLWMPGRSAVNQFVRWWIYRTWIVEWFGLRRWLYYFFLKRHVKSFKRHDKVTTAASPDPDTNTKAEKNANNPS